jgi:hypothetical protein
MNSADIKLKIFREVDSMSSSKLKELYGVMHNYINSKKDINEWIGTSMAEQQGVEAAIKELESDKGIAHQDVMHKFRSKYPHA